MLFGCIITNRFEAKAILDNWYTEQTSEGFKLSNAARVTELVYCGVNLRYKKRLKVWLKARKLTNILILGTAGACYEDLHAGDICSIDQVRNQANKVHTLNNAETGASLLSVNRPFSVIEKKKARQHYGVDLVDMETYQLARLLEKETPAVRVCCKRVVFEEVDEELPDLSAVQLNEVWQQRYELVQQRLALALDEWLSQVHDKSSLTNC